MGLVVLDAGVVIGALDSDDRHHQTSLAELTKARNAGDSVALPASAYAEVMVGPAHSGAAAEDVVRRLLDRFPIAVAPLDREIAEVAAELRARHRDALLLPDALVVATALALRADRLITTDRRWPSAAKLGLAKRLVTL